MINGSNRMFDLFTIFILALMTDTDSMITTTSDIFMGARFKVCIFTALLVVAHVFWNTVSVHSNETRSTSATFIAVLIRARPAIAIGFATRSGAVGVDFIFATAWWWYWTFETTLNAMTVGMTPSVTTLATFFTASVHPHARTVFNRYTNQYIAE